MPAAQNYLNELLKLGQFPNMHTTQVHCFGIFFGCYMGTDMLEVKQAVAADFWWFKHKNYQLAFKSMALHDWADILHERLVIRDAVSGEDFNLKGHSAPLYDAILKGDIKPPNGFGSGGRYSYADYVAFWNKDHVVQNVRPVSTVDALGLSEELKSFNDCIDDNDNHSDLFDLPIPFCSDVYPIDFLINQEHVPIATLMIGLDAPDDVILAELKGFLPKYRAAIKQRNSTMSKERSGKFPKNYIDKIRSYKVIEYLDIQIWLGVNRAKITDAALACLIFPDRIDNQTYFSQTVKPFVKKVTCREFIDSLSIKTRNAHINEKIKVNRKI